VEWCPDGDFWRLFCVLHLRRAACSISQTCILNSHWGHTMCGSMVDIQSSTAEIRRAKKEEETGWKYIWSALLHRATINNVLMILAQFVFKVCTLRFNACIKTCTPLPDCCINHSLIQFVPSCYTRTQFVDIVDPAIVDLLLNNSPDFIVHRL